MEGNILFNGRLYVYAVRFWNSQKESIRNRWFSGFFSLLLEVPSTLFSSKRLIDVVLIISITKQRQYVATYYPRYSNVGNQAVGAASTVTGHVGVQWLDTVVLDFHNCLYVPASRLRSDNNSQDFLERLCIRVWLLTRLTIPVDKVERGQLTLQSESASVKETLLKGLVTA